MNNAYINDIKYFLPENKELNSDVLSDVNYEETKIERMINKIGITSRRVSGRETFSNDLAVESARKVLKNYDSKK